MNPLSCPLGSQELQEMLKSALHRVEVENQNLEITTHAHDEIMMNDIIICLSYDYHIMIIIYYSYHMIVMIP